MESASPNQTPNDQTDDLTKADAAAFLAGFKPEKKDEPEYAGQDAVVANAVTQAQSVRNAHSSRRPPIVYIAAGVILILIVLLAVYLISKSQNTASKSPGGILAVPTPANSTTNGLNSTAQQELKTCSNVVNAALEC